MDSNNTDTEKTEGLDFIRTIVEADLKSGQHAQVVTRFPPEPNGYLHIGHAKSICLNFGIARQYGGRCHLRFDDTNPTKEDVEYVESIQRDIQWLGFDWGEHLYYASDYFERLYGWAQELIRKGKAYVCDLNEEQVREYRGTITEAGRPSPFRDRSPAENLDLLERMRQGEFEDGARTLRAKIDMASPNMKMRDPLLYRIRRHHHYRQGDKWCLYPLYDFTHGLSDSIEGVTHSICTLEFENNRELYDWFLESVTIEARPRQYEFARLAVDYTITSKRKLLALVSEGHVSGWDDPRMPTIAGLRRGGIPPEAIRRFCDRVGVAKNNSTVDVGLLEYTVRDTLNPEVPRVQAVLDPIKVVIENYPEGEAEKLEAPYYPHDVPKEGSRLLPFTRELFIERSDFEENPPPKWYRLAPGGEVRLRYAYIIRCNSVVKDDAGTITELRCSYDKATLGENPTDRKVKGTIHWVTAQHSLTAEVRLYDRLFKVPAPGSDDRDFREDLNPNSLTVLKGARLEPSLAAAKSGDRFQFERQGFFAVDPDSTADSLVFNRIVTLKDGWGKEAKKQKPNDAAEAAPTRARSTRQARGTAPKGKSAEPLSVELTTFRDAHGLSDADARLIGAEGPLRAFFEEAVAVHPDGKAVAKWVVNDVARLAKGKELSELPFTGSHVGELAALGSAGLSSQLSKAVFAEMAKTGESPKSLAEKDEFKEITDEAQLGQFVAQVLSEKAPLVARYRDGNANLFGALFGQAMRAAGGRAAPVVLERLLRAELDG